MPISTQTGHEALANIRLTCVTAGMSISTVRMRNSSTTFWHRDVPILTLDYDVAGFTRC